MTVNIAQILGGRNLCGVVEDVKGGLATDIIPGKAFNPTKTVKGAQGTYFKVTGTRETARAALYGSPSRLRGKKGITEMPVNLIHSFEHIHHNPVVLEQLKSESQAENQLAMGEVARQTGLFTQLFMNLRRAAWFMAISRGVIYFDSEGNLLDDSTGAAFSVDFGIPAGNKDQLDVLGNGDIITATWANAATDIIGQLGSLADAAMMLTGYPIKNAYYGKNIPGYVANNTAAKEFLKNDPAARQAITRGQIPNGFGDLNWTKASHAMVELAGTMTKMWGDDTIVFTPDWDDMGWWGFIEGTYPIPTSVGITSDAQAAMQNVRSAQGIFSYGKLIDDPVTVKQYGGDTFLPVIAVPKAVFIADVTP